MVWIIRTLASSTILGTGVLLILKLQGRMPTTWDRNAKCPVGMHVHLEAATRDGFMPCDCVRFVGRYAKTEELHIIIKTIYSIKGE